MSDRTSWWRLEHMAESDRRHAWLVKLVIVTMVFPVLLLTLMQPWKLVIYGLAWLLPSHTLWAQAIGWCAVVLNAAIHLWARVCAWALVTA